MKFLLIAALIASPALLADCVHDCKKNYNICKAKVDATGGFSYFKCIKDKDDCAKACTPAIEKK
jgi:hypothetical protein